MSLPTMDRTTRQKKSNKGKDLKTTRLNRNLQDMPSRDNRKRNCFQEHINFL